MRFFTTLNGSHHARAFRTSRAWLLGRCELDSADIAELHMLLRLP